MIPTYQGVSVKHPGHLHQVGDWLAPYRVSHEAGTFSGKNLIVSGVTVTGSDYVGGDLTCMKQFYDPVTFPSGLPTSLVIAKGDDSFIVQGMGTVKESLITSLGPSDSRRQWWISRASTSTAYRAEETGTAFSKILSTYPIDSKTYTDTSVVPPVQRTAYGYFLSNTTVNCIYAGYSQYGVFHFVNPPTVQEIGGASQSVGLFPASMLPEGAWMTCSHAGGLSVIWRPHGHRPQIRNLDDYRVDLGLPPGTYPMYSGGRFYGRKAHAGVRSFAVVSGKL